MIISGQWLSLPAAAAILGCICGVSLAQNAPSGEPAPPGAVGSLGSMTTPPGPDPLVAQVGDQQIHMSDLTDEIRELPGGGSPGAFAGLYNIALRRLIDRKAVVAQAVRIGLAIDPTVVRHMGEASDTVLEEAYLQKATTDRVTESMLLARYQAEIAGKPGPQAVHGWAILVPTEAQATDIIAKLTAGADFSALAHQVSKDGSAHAGGDLGFVQRANLSPEVGAVLFELRPDQVAPYPVPTPVGWFVLKAGARQTTPTPTFAEAHDRLLAECQRDAVGAVIAAALRAAAVQTYDANGNVTAPPPQDDAP